MLQQQKDLVDSKRLQSINLGISNAIRFARIHEVRRLLSLDERRGRQFILCSCNINTLHLTLYFVSQKSIPDIFHCNLKTNYQILIIFGASIPDTNCHQITVISPPHLMYAFILPRESRLRSMC